ncbi:AEC family transporter [Piscinibacter sakaiensis]|uniref:AEC family transporter n=1 Tax=Piscinibacter sakaiensis TaxID=1547922 RepID=UPI003AAE3F48
MLNVLGVTAPIYLLIAAGFITVRMGWMAGSDMRILGRFVAQFCVPALLFRAVTRQPLDQVLHGDFLFVYAAGSLLTVALVLAVALRLRRASLSLAAVQALGAAGSNSVFIGYPLALQLIGPSAGIALALTTLVENMLIIPLLLALAASGSGERRAGPVLRATALGLLRNPMILAIVAGALVSAFGIGLHPVLDRTVAMAAAAAPPTALFVIGGTLVGLQLTGMRADIALVAGGKLLIHPLCIALFVWLLPPADPLLRAAAVLFAAMPMLSIYPVLAQRFGHERFSAAALLAATVASFVTISLAIALIPAGWIAYR